MPAKKHCYFDEKGAMVKKIRNKKRQLGNEEVQPTAKPIAKTWIAASLLLND
jgi:hypothetical protein